MITSQGMLVCSFNLLLVVKQISRIIEFNLIVKKKTE